MTQLTHSLARNLLLSLVIASTGFACGDDDDGDDANVAGSGGTKPSGGTGGAKPSGGTGGTAGSKPTGGTGGTAGAKPTGGTGGSAGAKSDVDAGADQDAGSVTEISFFVSSDKSATGKLNGLDGADARCKKLADAIGAGSKTWHAYLSTDTVNARDRIGQGPWYNAKGAKLANNLDDLHNNVKGNADLFLDEKGNKINGQWTGSPTPNEHDILTGSKQDGTLAKDDQGKSLNCDNWTSDAADVTAQVGHSDGLGPMQMTGGTYTSWNAAHTAQDCSNTAPRGGAGRIYCFAAD